MWKLKIKTKYPGLTLIELLVSISIIAMVTTIFIVNYQASTQRTDLMMTAQMLVSDIYRAQNNAMGLVKYGTEVPAGGWGIHFNINEPTKYYIFADLEAPGQNGNLIFDANTEGDNNQGARMIELPPNIEIAALSNDGVQEMESAMMNMIFLPPDPRVSIYSETSSATSTELYIYLKDVSNDNTADYKVIKANILGLAEVLETAQP